MTNPEAERLEWIDAWTAYVVESDDREWGPIHSAITESELEERRETGHVMHRL